MNDLLYALDLIAAAVDFDPRLPGVDDHRVALALTALVGAAAMRAGEWPSQIAGLIDDTGYPIGAVDPQFHHLKKELPR